MTHEKPRKTYGLWKTDGRIPEYYRHKRLFFKQPMKRPKVPKKE